MQRYARALREGIDGTALLGGVLVVAGIYALTGVDGATLGLIAGIGAGAPLAGTLFDALDVDVVTARVAFGAVVGVTGGVIAARSSIAVGIAVAAIGAWFVLDALSQWCADGPADRTSPRELQPGPRALVRDALRRLARPFRLLDPR